MEHGAGPAVLLNRFSVRSEEADRFLAAWTADAEIMKR